MCNHPKCLLFSHVHQGFICPVCMISLDSPESLQIHFETAHVDSEPTNGVRIMHLSLTQRVLSIQWKIPVWSISVCFQWWLKQHFLEFLEKRTTLQDTCTPKIFGKFLPGIFCFIWLSSRNFEIFCWMFCFLKIRQFLDFLEAFPGNV